MADGILEENGCGAESEPRKKRGWPVDQSVRTFKKEWQAQLTRTNDIAQRLSIRGVLGDGLAKVQRLACPVVDGECEMVRGNGAGHRLAARLYCFDGGRSRRVFEHDA